MAYMNKDARRTAILDAAIALIVSEGLAAVTVRGVARNLQAATGLVNHHFTSATLRAEAFELLMQQCLKVLVSKAQPLGPAQQLLLMLGNWPESEQVPMPNAHIWNEAQFLANKEPELAEVLTRSMSEWFQAVLQIVEQGVASQVFRPITSCHDSAWRLLGLSCGLEEMLRFKGLGFAENEFERLLQDAIALELLP